MLADGILDDEESAELLTILTNISGEPSEVGELAKTTTLPLCSPVPTLNFDGGTFLFTGTFVFGNRGQCHEATESLGDVCSKGSVTKKLDHLIIGSYVTDSWKHETVGAKILKAMDYRERGVPISIVSEETWLGQGGFSA